jgi:hypothetical protein
MILTEIQMVFILYFALSYDDMMVKTSLTLEENFGVLIVAWKRESYSIELCATLTRADLFVADKFLFNNLPFFLWCGTIEKEGKE